MALENEPKILGQVPYLSGPGGTIFIEEWQKPNGRIVYICNMVPRGGERQPGLPTKFNQLAAAQPDDPDQLQLANLFANLTIADEELQKNQFMEDLFGSTHTD